MEEDVTQAEPSTADQEVAETEQAPVSAETGRERPVENLAAEFNRKHRQSQQEMAELRNQLSQVVGLLQQQQRPQQPQGQVTDEELFERAKMGDQAAFAEWTDRRARRQYQQEFQQRQQQETIAGQLAAMQRKYPQFGDQSSQLNMAARQAYQLLVARGYAEGPQTLLTAMHTAVSDNPQIIAEIYGQAARTSDDVRRSATRVAQAGQTGGSVRNESPAPRTGAVRPLTKEQQRLARQMGLDDEKAKTSMQRFKQRRETGQSNIGAVGNMIDEESL